jgi:hypothetical protein
MFSDPFPENHLKIRATSYNCWQLGTSLQMAQRRFHCAIGMGWRTWCVGTGHDGAKDFLAHFPKTAQNILCVFQTEK